MSNIEDSVDQTDSDKKAVTLRIPADTYAGLQKHYGKAYTGVSVALDSWLEIRALLWEQVRSKIDKAFLAEFIAALPKKADRNIIANPVVFAAIVPTYRPSLEKSVDKIAKTLTHAELYALVDYALCFHRIGIPLEDYVDSLMGK